LDSIDRFSKRMTDDLKTLAANVARLSQFLTSDRKSLPRAYLKDAGLRKAYISYFLPTNTQKIRIPLQDLSRRPGNLLSQARLRILDIGTGPGTALLGVMDFFFEQENSPELECTAVDPVAENLKEAEAFFAAHRDKMNIRASLKTIRADIESVENLLDEGFDIIILSNVLNELFSQDERRIDKRIGILKNILSHVLSDTGSCIIIEPALRETSRELLKVRDGLLVHGFRIFSPCFFSGNCPALINPKDWCHEDIPWQPPDDIKEIDRLTGLRKDSLKFSYLVLRKDIFSLSDACDMHAVRIVSEPLISKGKVEFYICGRYGRRLITRLDKDRTTKNQLFETMHRGNVISCEQLLDEGKRLKVEKATKVCCLF